MNRSHPITVYLSPEEKATIEAEAGALGMSLSQYVRMRASTGWHSTYSTGNDGTFTFSMTTNNAVQNREVK